MDCKVKSIYIKFCVRVIILYHFIYGEDSLPVSKHNHHSLPRMEVDGDVYVIGIFPTSIENQGFQNDTLLWAVALKYATDVFNERFKTIKVGYIIYDSCNTNETIEFMSSVMSNTKYRAKILGVVSVLSTEQANEIGKYLSQFHLPLFTFKGNLSIPSDFSDSILTKNYIDIQNIDHKEINLIERILTNNNWSYIGIITTDDIYGKYARSLLWNTLKNTSCLAAKVVDVKNTSSVINAIEAIEKDDKLKVFILWMEPSNAITFATKVKRFMSPKKFFLSNSDLSNIAVPHLYRDTFQKHGNSFPVYSLRSFLKYFYSLTFDNNNNITWVKYYFQAYNMTTFSGNLSELKNYFHIFLGRYALQGAIANLAGLVDLALNFNKSSLSANTLRKTAENNVKYFQHIDHLSNFNGSRCVINCSRGFMMKYEYVERPRVKGWDYKLSPLCVACVDNCFNSEQKFSDYFIGYDDAASITIYIFMMVGFVFSIFVIIVFIRYADTPLVKASNKNKSLVQLFLHALLFCILILFFGKPTKIICTIRPMVVGILMTFILAITLVRTQQLVFIFNSQCKVSKSQIQLSATMESAVIFFMLCVQTFIAILSCIFHASRVSRIETKKGNFDYCTTEDELLIQLAFGFLLMFMCLIQAFKARGIPENFNESKFISVSMFLCILVVLILLPIRFIVKTYKVKVYIEVLMLISINYILFVAMYAYKCWVILFLTDRNTVSAYQQNLRNHWLKGFNGKKRDCVVLKSKFASSRSDSDTSMITLEPALIAEQENDVKPP